MAAAVAITWLAIGLVIAAQNSLASRLGGTYVPFGSALHTSMVQTLTWIPGTLLIIELALHWPLTRATWTRTIPIHIIAVPVVAFIANTLVVLWFWISSHSFKGVATLAQQGAHWTFVYFHIGVLIYTVVLGLTQAIVYYRATRLRELHVARIEGQLAVARLQALNAQLRPHFLFNTLHTIGQMWRSGRNDDADAVLDHLGNLFHRVQAASSQIEVPLADELDLVRQYLAIEQARFPDRLRCEVRATPGACACMVPPLLLQPIVENAVRHGISAASSAGRIEVEASVENDTLVVTVTDDGPGFHHSTSAPGAGTGLRNTRERIAELYGDAAEVTTTDLENGAQVRIRIPVNARRFEHA